MINKSSTNNCKFFCYLAFLLTCFSVSGQNTVSVDGDISLRDIFDPKTNLSGGIKGEVNQGGHIQIELWTYNESDPNKKGTLLYLHRSNVTSLEFSGSPYVYNRNTIPNHQDSKWVEHYPSSWTSDDIKSAVWGIDKSRYDDTAKTSIYDFLTFNQKVRVFFFTTNALLLEAKIPGLGILSPTGGNILFDPNHFCHDVNNSDDPICRTWKKIKTPKVNQGSDLVYAAHRGYWGYDLGDGPPENTPEAIQSALNYTTVIESDIMRTKDNQMVVSHDYNLHRLTNYTGPDTDYIFDKNLSELTSLKLKKRNESVSNNNFITFADLIDEMVAKKTVLTIDIKGARPRLNPYTKVCEARCNYDPRQNPNAYQFQKEDFMLILRKCIEITNTKNALQYVAFKTTYTYNDILQNMPTGFDKNLLTKVLYFPVIQPGNDVNVKAQFVDDWYNQAGERVMAYETNFKSTDESYLKPFIRHEKQFQNLLHYVYDQTNLRPGIYSEEAMGPKGIVDRWAQWLIKDASTDIRGDHYYLMSVPYFRISVLTTDRPDIWLQIQANFN